MAQYAIAFDLSQRKMKDAGHSQSDITKVYQVEIPAALNSCGFTGHLQGSVYCTEADNPDSIVALMKLQGALRQMAPTFCRYVSSVHVFRMEEWSDVTPIVADRSAEVPTIEDEMHQQDLLEQFSDA